MERKEFYEPGETFMADCALTMVTPKVLVMLFLVFWGQNSALQLLERGLWAEFNCFLNLPVGGYLTLKRCVFTLCSRGRRQPREKFSEHGKSPQLIAQKTPCCGLDLRKSGRVEQKGLMNAQRPSGRAVIQSCALWNRVQHFPTLGKCTSMAL